MGFGERVKRWEKITVYDEVAFGGVLNKIWNQVHPIREIRIKIKLITAEFSQI